MNTEKYPGKAQTAEKLTSGKRECIRQRTDKIRDEIALKRKIAEEVGE